MNTTPVDAAVEESQDQVAEYRKGIRQCFVEMDRIQQQMDADQREIERLRAETRRILSQFQAA